MEAKELRIGNYVDFCGISKILELHSEIKKFDNVYLECEESFEWGEYERLKPIPLTEEILLKCGLKRALYDSSYELNDFSIFLDKRIRENIYIQCEKRNCNVLNGLRIDYLHQLQNLYFALTNEELTVNL